MLNVVAGAMPAKSSLYREAQTDIDDLAAEIAAAEPDGDRLGLIQHHAEAMYGYAMRGLADHDDVADILHCASVGCGAVRDYGQDRVQAAIAAGVLEAKRERRREIGNGKRYQSTCLADVVPVPIRWLWPQRLALGKVSLLVGQPGVGKSQLSCALAAAVTRGGRLPDGAHAPKGSVVFVTCEDDPADTIVPRLAAAGADLERVHHLAWIVDPKDAARREHFSVAAHHEALAEMIAAIGDVRLLIIDPITAYMGAADSHKTADVRQALAPLQELAAAEHVAVLAISHLNKNGAEGSALNRVVGSGAFVAVARSAWLIAADPGDEDGQRRIFTPLKNNIGDDQAGFAFAVEGVELGGGITTSRVVFEAEPVRVDADELLRDQGQQPEERGARQEAEDWLYDLLANCAPGTGLATKTVTDQAAAAGISERTLRRARARLGIRATKSEGGGPWVMILPDHVRQARAKAAKAAKGAKISMTAKVAALVGEAA